MKPIRRGQLLHMIRSILTPSKTASPASSTESFLPTAEVSRQPLNVSQDQLQVQRQKRKFITPEEISLPSAPSPRTTSAIMDGLLLDGSIILVAEDNETNRKVVSHFLEQANCRVIEAVNGVEAVDKLTDQIKAVVMDVHMPVTRPVSPSHRTY